MTTEQSALAALVDGVALSADDARELWKRFSDYMGEHRGDFSGFAKVAGYVQIAPEYRNGKAVLVAYTKEPPKAALARPGKPKSTAVKPKSAGGKSKPGPKKGHGAPAPKKPRKH